MKKAVKGITVMAAIISIMILVLTGYYYYNLPNHYYITGNSSLNLYSYFKITSSPSSNVKPVFSANSIDEKFSNTVMLKLFSSVPIKEVTTQKVDAPALVPGGEPFGVKLISNGVMVVKLEKSQNGCPAKSCGIKCGDIVISINGVKVSSNKEISDAIMNSNGETIPVVICRNGQQITLKLTPTLWNGSYRAGMWVRDSSAGIGTITFYDPSTQLFGGLGHPVCDSDTGDTVSIKEGSAESVNIHGFNKSVAGDPGSLLGNFTGINSIGEIYSNRNCGIFGRLNSSPSSKTTIPLGYRQEIRKGDATIYTTISGSKPKEYSIKIEEIDLIGSGTKNMVIRVTDKELLKQTGGILQGMSGSPIIQNGKLVGAVTHVFVRDTTMGYGVFADEMYNSALESDKLQENDLAS